MPVPIHIPFVLADGNELCQYDVPIGARVYIMGQNYSNPSDTKGNSYSTDAVVSDGFNTLRICSAKIENALIGSVDRITVTASGFPPVGIWACRVLLGVDHAFPIDGVVQGTHTHPIGYWNFAWPIGTIWKDKYTIVLALPYWGGITGGGGPFGNTCIQRYVGVDATRLPYYAQTSETCGIVAVSYKGVGSVVCPTGGDPPPHDDDDDGKRKVRFLRHVTRRRFSFRVNDDGHQITTRDGNEDQAVDTITVDNDPDCAMGEPWEWRTVLELAYLRARAPKLARSFDHGEHWLVTNIPGEYIRLTAASYRNRVVVLGFRNDTWYARAAKREDDGTIPTGNWSPEVALTLTNPSGQGFLVAREDDALEFLWKDTNGVFRYLHCYGLGADGAGVWV